METKCNSFWFVPLSSSKWQLDGCVVCSKSEVLDFCAKISKLLGCGNQGPTRLLRSSGLDLSWQSFSECWTWSWRLCLEEKWGGARSRRKFRFWAMTCFEVSVEVSVSWFHDNAVMVIGSGHICWCARPGHPELGRRDGTWFGSGQTVPEKRGETNWFCDVNLSFYMWKNGPINSLKTLPEIDDLASYGQGFILSSWQLCGKKWSIFLEIKQLVIGMQVSSCDGLDKFQAYEL